MQHWLLWADSVEKPGDFDASVEAIALIYLGCGSPDHPSTRGVLHWLELGQFAEVLGGGCEGELVLNAAWPS